MGLKVAILLTVFNRREKTLKCLDICYRQIDAMKSEGTYDFQIFMVDDGSSDGTGEAVRETFPQTAVIRSDGGLFWNQGMRLAWDTAALQTPDFYIWINDDTLLRPNALSILMETSNFLKHRAIIVGTAEDSKGRLSYGGRTRYGKIVSPDPTIPVPCWTFNGNFVLIPAYVYRILGNLDEHYQHSYGDFDYGVRAAAANIVRVVAPGILCECNRNPGIPKWRDRNYPLRDRIASLHSPKGRPPKEQIRYDVRSRGFIFALIHGLSVAVKVFFPKRNNDE